MNREELKQVIKKQAQTIEDLKRDRPVSVVVTRAPKNISFGAKLALMDKETTTIELENEDGITWSFQCKPLRVRIRV